MEILFLKYFTLIALLFVIWMIANTFGKTMVLELDVAAPESKAMEVDLEFLGSPSVILKIFASTSHPAVNHSVTVLASQDSSLMGFVKMAHLRVNWINLILEENSDNKSDFFPECLDFIEIDDDKICHEVQPKDRGLHPPSLIGPRSITALKGHNIPLFIHMDKLYLPHAQQKKTVKHLAEILFTSYSDCSAEKDLFVCGEDDVSCIPSSLVCDSEIHCLFPDTFGQDEIDCEMKFETNSTTSSSSDKDRKSKDNSKPQRKKGVVDVGVVSKEEDGVVVKYREHIRHYFVPTAAFFFLIWGVITLLRKCYNCYRSEYGKDDLYY